MGQVTLSPRAAATQTLQARAALDRMPPRSTTGIVCVAVMTLLLALLVNAVGAKLSARLAEGRTLSIQADPSIARPDHFDPMSHALQEASAVADLHRPVAFLLSAVALLALTRKRQALIALESLYWALILAVSGAAMWLDAFFLMHARWADGRESLIAAQSAIHLFLFVCTVVLTIVLSLTLRLLRWSSRRHLS